MGFQAVLAEIESWPAEDRIRLVQEVWDGLLDRGHEFELSQEWKDELDRRIREMDSNPELGVPWEVVKADALERFRK